MIYAKGILKNGGVFLGVLAVMGCGVVVNNKVGVENQMGEVNLPVRQRCIEVANKRLAKAGLNLGEYVTEFSENDFYKVVYVPRELQFGGGAEVVLDKKTLEVKKIIFHQ